MVSKTLDIRKKRELIPEIWKTNEMIPIIALAYYLESFHAETHACMGIQVETSSFNNVNRCSWKFRNVKC